MSHRRSESFEEKTKIPCPFQDFFPTCSCSTFVLFPYLFVLIVLACPFVFYCTTHNTNIHAPGEILLSIVHVYALFPHFTHSSATDNKNVHAHASKRAIPDSSPRPRGHWNRRVFILFRAFFSFFPSFLLSFLSIVYLYILCPCVTYSSPIN